MDGATTPPPPPPPPGTNPGSTATTKVEDAPPVKLKVVQKWANSLVRKYMERPFSERLRLVHPHAHRIPASASPEVVASMREQHARDEQRWKFELCKPWLMHMLASMFMLPSTKEALGVDDVVMHQTDVVRPASTMGAMCIKGKADGESFMSIHPVDAQTSNNVAAVEVGMTGSTNFKALEYMVSVRDAASGTKWVLFPDQTATGFVWKPFTSLETLLCVEFGVVETRSKDAVMLAHGRFFSRFSKTVIEQARLAWITANRPAFSEGDEGLVEADAFVRASTDSIKTWTNAILCELTGFASGLSTWMAPHTSRLYSMITTIV